MYVCLCVLLADSIGVHAGGKEVRVQKCAFLCTEGTNIEKLNALTVGFMDTENYLPYSVNTTAT